MGGYLLTTYVRPGSQSSKYPPNSGHHVKLQAIAIIKRHNSSLCRGRLNNRLTPRDLRQNPISNSRPTVCAVIFGIFPWDFGGWIRFALFVGRRKFRVVAFFVYFPLKKYTKSIPKHSKSKDSGEFFGICGGNRENLSFQMMALSCMEIPN